MGNHAVGLTFRETMQGGFALLETDPEAGRHKGAATQINLIMHATIWIGDIERFLTNPEHRGELSGIIDSRNKDMRARA